MNLSSKDGTLQRADEEAPDSVPVSCRTIWSWGTDMIYILVVYYIISYLMVNINDNMIYEV